MQVLEVGQSHPLKHGQDRHERMLQKGEFDICELSLSSYLIAKSRGMPFTAIPVFPRRLFSLSQMWVNVNAGIKSPQDLVGKKVGLSTFQTTLSVLAKGDLQAEYNVPWREIDWYISKDEAVPLKPMAGVKMQLLKPGQKIGAMLENGEIDALMVPHPPKKRCAAAARFAACSPIRRPKRRSISARTATIPIMHVVAFKDEVLSKNPWLAKSRDCRVRQGEGGLHGILRRSQLVALCLGPPFVRRGARRFRRRSLAAWHREEPRQPGALYRLFARSGVDGEKAQRGRIVLSKS